MDNEQGELGYRHVDIDQGQAKRRGREERVLTVARVKRLLILKGSSTQTVGRGCLDTKFKRVLQREEPDWGRRCRRGEATNGPAGQGV